MKYRQSLKKTDFCLKGFAVAIVLFGVLSMTFKSGGALNPAVALAESCLMFVRQSQHKQTPSSKVLWVYMIGPMLGASLAAGFYILQNRYDQKKFKPVSLPVTRPVSNNFISSQILIHPKRLSDNKINASTFLTQRSQ